VRSFPRCAQPELSPCWNTAVAIFKATSNITASVATSAACSGTSISLAGFCSGGLIGVVNGAASRGSDSRQSSRRRSHVRVSSIISTPSPRGSLSLGAGWCNSPCPVLRGRRALGPPLLSSRESDFSQGADAVSLVEGNTGGRASASVRPALRGLRPWHVRTLLVREPGDLQLKRKTRRDGMR
jgi:hypothetical protein